MYRAVLKSQEYLLKRYIAAKPDLVDVPGPNGLTPIANAIITGNKYIVDLFITAQANVNVACMILKRTPLQVRFHLYEVQ